MDVEDEAVGFIGEVPRTADEDHFFTLLEIHRQARLPVALLAVTAPAHADELRATRGQDRVEVKHIKPRAC